MKDKESNFISAVLYVYNDADIVGDFIEQLSQALNDNFNKFEIICVNDCSTDDSAKSIMSAAKSMSPGGSVVIVNMGFYHGLEASIEAGVDFACGDFVFEFDAPSADYDFNLIAKTYYRSLQGYDIVGASSKIGARMSSKIFYSLFNANAKTQYKLKTESFHVLSRRAINRIKQMNVSLPYRKVVYANCGLKVDSIDYAPRANVKASRRPRLYDRTALAVDSFILFTNIANKISLAMSLIMLAFSLFVGGYTIVIFFRGHPVEGWTTTMLSISFGFFGMFVLLTIVIRYLSIILRLIFKKAKYVVGSIEKF